MDYKLEIRKLKYLVDVEFRLNDHELDSRGRKGKLAMARILYGNLIMTELSLKPSQVPKYLNRDRSLFYYYDSLHQNYMTDARIYPEYFNHYNNIKAKYYDMSDALLRAKSEERMHKLLYDVDCNIEKLEKERQMIIDNLC